MVKDKRAFTLLELMAVVAILAILAALLFPVFARARQSGLITASMSKMEQIGRGFAIYAGEYDDNMPHASWDVVIEEISNGRSALGPPYDQRASLQTLSEVMHEGHFSYEDFRVAGDPGPPPGSWAATGLRGHWTSFIYDDLQELMHQTFGAVPNPSTTMLLMEAADPVRIPWYNKVPSGCLRTDLHIEKRLGSLCLSEGSYPPGR